MLGFVLSNGPKNVLFMVFTCFQVFHFHVVAKNRECRMFPDDVIPEMFSNIKSIYQFHHDFLFPRLKERMADW